MVLLIFVVLVIKDSNKIQPTGEDAAFFDAFIQNDSDSSSVQEYDYSLYPLFVGDSRTVGLAEAIPGLDYHAKSGSTYYYLLELDSLIRNSGADCIIIGFGVNDLVDIDEYINYANKLGDEISARVYFLTVNPVDETKESYNGYHIKNSRIDSFNERLTEEARSYTVIDTNGFLKEVGYNTMDGLHYDENTYINIYDYVMDYLYKNMEY